MPTHEKPERRATDDNHREEGKVDGDRTIGSRPSTLGDGPRRDRPGSGPARDRLRHGGGRAGLRDEVALTLVATLRLEAVELGLGLDSLTGGPHAQAGAQPDHCPDNETGIGCRRDVAHERLVDLNLVEGKAAQVAQGRVARAEIVHGDADPEAPQGVQGRQGGDVVLEQDRLRDLEFEALGPKPAGRQGLAHGGDDDFVAELHRRDVDRDLDAVGPAHGLLAGGFQAPGAQRHDETDLLGDGDEFARRDEAARRVDPAHQGLEPADAPGPEVVDGLVMQLEFAVGQGLAQVEFEGTPGLKADVHVDLEEAPRAPTVGLGTVQGDVGVLEELVTTGAVARCEADADADADADLMSVEGVGRADHLDDAPGQHRGVVRAMDVAEDDREFVAAEARDRIDLAHAGTEALGHGAQERVADGMPQGVVDLLEPVEVEAEHGEPAAASEMGQGFVDTLDEDRPVR